ncbi:response regulator transcription factor [Myroides injenensis]|uniref:response regulator transcription factor n=1 Tax=Myroides injenensis TaxID=1183151 RepID=UPI000289555F|nr:response regulator transcription factor [Myroides injenensis]
MFLVKNYHKLLQKEKNNLPQNNNNNQIIISENIDSQDLIRKQYKLTDREVEVLKLVWNGLSNKEIAQELNITISTTKYHISNIFIKLNVSSRTQLFSLKN